MFARDPFCANAEPAKAAAARAAANVWRTMAAAASRDVGCRVRELSVECSCQKDAGQEEVRSLLYYMTLLPSFGDETTGAIESERTEWTGLGLGGSCAGLP